MKKRIPLIVSLIVLSLAVFIKTSDFTIVKQLQLKIFDSFQIKQPREYTPQPIKIIDIDDDSLQKIGQWPWPRSKIAKLVDKLTQAGAAVIVMDIVFPEEDRTSPKNILKLWDKTKDLSYLLNELPDHDDLLAKSIAESNVVTGFVLSHEDSDDMPSVKSGYSYAGNDPKPYLPSFKGAINSLEKFESVSSGNGALNSLPDDDGILRRMAITFSANGQLIPSLTAEALRVAQGASTYIIKTVGASGEKSFGNNTMGITSIKNGAFEIPTDAAGQFLIYYSEYEAERYIPAWTILQSEAELPDLEGYILFIGTSAAGLRDIRATPLNPTSSGVEVHVQTIEQILGGQFLKRPDWMHGAEIILMVFIGLLLIITMAKLSAIWGAVFTACTLVAAISFSWHAFTQYKMLIDPITPGIAIILLYLSESLSRYIGNEQEKKQVRNAFSHYMSPALVDQLAKNPEKLTLGGEDKELTLLFCDIRGFTTISENFDAQELTQFINQFLTPMTTIILNNQGTIDKYMGDCIMAFWNAPLDDEIHARHACLSALSMIESLKTLNEKQEQAAIKANRKFIPINIGIGLNSGPCCVGNMGSDQRFDYSVLGDDVNLASRLEGQSKTYGVEVVIGDNTHEYVKDEMAVLEIDLITVKGKTKPVNIYTLLGNLELAESEVFLKFKHDFESMLNKYRSKQFKESLASLEKAKKSHSQIKNIDLSILLDLYDNRINEFITNPPDINWDGVFVATTK